MLTLLNLNKECEQWRDQMTVKLNYFSPSYFFQTKYTAEGNYNHPVSPLSSLKPGFHSAHSPQLFPLKCI